MTACLIVMRINNQRAGGVTGDLLRVRIGSAAAILWTKLI
jgi:hypothetical protein